MRKLISILLVVLLLISAIACDPDSGTVNDVTFDVSVNLKHVGEDNKESVAYVGDATWTYTAVKSDDGYTTGETKEEKELGDGDLTLSLGYWTITVNGYSGENLTYTGTFKTEGAITADTEIAVEVKPVEDVQEGDITFYDKLEDAITNAAAGATVTLLKDLALDDYLTISKSMVLDGNNHTLTMACKSLDNGASGLYITGDDVKSVLVKDITLKADGVYPSQTALVYIHYCSADVALENVVMECNPDGTSEKPPIGVQSVYREKGKISVNGCTIKGAKYGMYFNSISDGVIENNTIDGTLYNGIILSGDSKEDKYASKNVVIKNNVLKNVASNNYKEITYNCGIYIGEHTSDITVEGNFVTLAASSTNGKAIVYYKDTVESKEE